MRHSCVCERAYHVSKSPSPHLRERTGWKSRYTRDHRPRPGTSPRLTCHTSINFCDVESETVDSARARIVKGILSAFHERPKSVE